MRFRYAFTGLMFYYWFFTYYYNVRISNYKWKIVMDVIYITVVACSYKATDLYRQNNPACFFTEIIFSAMSGLVVIDYFLMLQNDLAKAAARFYWIWVNNLYPANIWSSPHPAIYKLDQSYRFFIVTERMFFFIIHPIFSIVTAFTIYILAPDIIDIPLGPDQMQANPAPVPQVNNPLNDGLVGAPDNTQENQPVDDQANQQQVHAQPNQPGIDQLNPTVPGQAAPVQGGPGGPNFGHLMTHV